MKSAKQINDDLLNFISASPTAFHAVENIAGKLSEHGYIELPEGEDWQVEYGGKYFVRRNGSSLIALRLPEKDLTGFMMMAAHSDSPAFRIKESAEVRGSSYLRLSVEKYGGLICSTWLDRPLSAAGRAVVRNGDGFAVRNVNLDRNLFIIPSVAIHMDRNVNDGKAFNVNVDMLPLASGNPDASFTGMVARALGVEKEDVLSTDLYLYVRDKGTALGMEQEFICSPRLDDLQCAWACLQGLLSAGENSSGDVLCIFDNEEVGSGTKQGADSGFLEDVLIRTCESLGKTSSEFRRLISQSFMVSADNAHAIHPNHPEYADRNDAPVMNGGIVIKSNASQRYTTDAVSAAVFREICRDAEVPVQSFTNRSDLAGGSTLGNISTSHVSLNTVDIGLPQLAMHSAFETAGAKDTAYLVRAAEEFYSRDFSMMGDQLSI